MVTHRRTSRSRPRRRPERRKVWSETYTGFQNIAATTAFNVNLMTDVDNKLGIFVNKGFTMIRAVGDLMVYPQAAVTAGFGIQWAILAGDPNLPLTNLNAFQKDIRKMLTGTFWLPLMTAAITATTATLTCPPQHFDTGVKYAFPDEREDLWLSWSNNGNIAVDVAYNVRVLLEMP